MSTKPFITCEIAGQLGNQLFQIATTLSYSWEHNVLAFFPALCTDNWRASYNKDRIFFRVNTSSLPRSCKHLFRENLWYQYKPIPFLDDLVIRGYFQSWKYFDKYRDRIFKVFAPSDLISDKIKNKYSDIIKNPKAVGIHIRTRGKFLHESGAHPFLGFDYYRKAMECFPNDSLFVICSDRIEWCKQQLYKNISGKNYTFVEGNDGIEDMFILSMIKNTITSGSTFSWWSAYLNQNVDSKIIVPEFWGGDPQAPIPPRDLLLPSWTILPVTIPATYPEDMYHYGETTDWDGNW